MAMSKFQDKLKEKMDEYAHFAYITTKKFPKDELYGITSQMRRSALSVILNYIEGYARRKPAVRLHFLEISYGSLKESRYLIHFSHKEDLVSAVDYARGMALAEEIGAMLWTELKSLDKGLSG